MAAWDLLGTATSTPVSGNLEKEEGGDDDLHPRPQVDIGTPLGNFNSSQDGYPWVPTETQNPFALPLAWSFSNASKFERVVGLR